MMLPQLLESLLTDSEEGVDTEWLDKVGQLGEIVLRCAVLCCAVPCRAVSCCVVLCRAQHKPISADKGSQTVNGRYNAGHKWYPMWKM